MSRHRGASPFTPDGRLPEGAAKQQAVRSMFDAIAPRYDLVNRVMTFRMDVGWRKRTVAALALRRRCDGARPRLRHRRPVPGAGSAVGYRPIGADLSFGMLAAARTDAPLVHADALRLPFPDDAVDGVTCGFALRNFVDLEAFLAEAARVVRPGGRIAFLEVAEPENRLLRRGHAVYFGKVVPRIGGLLSDRDAYRYLPQSVAYLPEPGPLIATVARRRLRRRRATAAVGRHRPAARRDAGWLRLVARRRDASTATSTSSPPPVPTACSSSAARSGLAGRGVALRVRCDEAAEALAAIAVDDEVGAAGVRPGGLRGAAVPPERRSPTAELVVPEVVWGRAEDGSRWVTTVGEAAVPEPVTARSGPARSHRARSRLAPSRPAAEWCDLVAAATAAIGASGGALEKVVLAREVVVEAEAPFDRMAVLGAAAGRRIPVASSPMSTGSSVPSPELLVLALGRRGAGPADGRDRRLGAATRRPTPGWPRRCSPTPTYRHEHQVTIDEVHDTLLGWCSYVDFEPEPSVVAVANLQHLATLVEGRLSRPAPSVLELVAALHPTPAVAGRPRDAAIDWIVAHEGFDRGRYAGAVGWVDAAGNGQWAVSVRCAELDGRRGAGLRRQRHRRRLRPRHRAHRDPGQAPSPPRRPDPPASNSDVRWKPPGLTDGPSGAL